MIPHGLTTETVLRVVSKGLIPYILLFAAYTQFHGDLGPGGGFQAGVVAAAAFILYGLVLGTDALDRAWTPRAREVAMALGVLLYGGTGVLTLLLGGDFLDYNQLSAVPYHGQHTGIFLVELGVGLTVSSVMTALFSAFGGYRMSEKLEHEDEL